MKKIVLLLIVSIILTSFIMVTDPPRCTYRTGTGMITTSGHYATGYGTRFTAEVRTLDSLEFFEGSARVAAVISDTQIMLTADADSNPDPMSYTTNRRPTTTTYLPIIYHVVH